MLSHHTVDRDKIKDLIVDGLTIDGAHHKQWFLEMILKQLGFSLKKIKKEMNNLGYDWEDGIAP